MSARRPSPTRRESTVVPDDLADGEQVGGRLDHDHQDHDDHGDDRAEREGRGAEWNGCGSANRLASPTAAVFAFPRASASKVPRTRPRRIASRDRTGSC